jgi:nitroreductase
VSERRDADLFAVVHRQRACRMFSDEPVPDSLIAEVLDAATYAPSAENRQPWEFVVVRDPRAREGLGDVMRRAWAGGGRAFAEARIPAAMLEEVDRGMTGGVAGAPVLLVVAADTQRGLPETVASSIFPAVQNLLLAATALGLGSALTTLAAVFGDEVRSLTHLPDHVEPVALVPLGYPPRPLGPPRREPFADHTHREHYGKSW